jgi:hypothetical protein
MIITHHHKNNKEKKSKKSLRLKMLLLLLQIVNHILKVACFFLAHHSLAPPLSLCSYKKIYLQFEMQNKKTLNFL